MGRQEVDCLSDVRDIVMRFGFNATAYQILNPGIEHWVMGTEAAVGFVHCGKRWVAAGGPVCEGEKLAEVVEAFEAAARAAGAKVCFVCAGERLRELLADRKDHAVIAIGAEPIWTPAQWAGLVTTHAAYVRKFTAPKTRAFRFSGGTIYRAAGARSSKA